MKKFIVTILSSFLFASNSVVLKKEEKRETNSTIREELILKKWLIDKFNSIMPDYLQAEPKENMINLSIGYDTRTKKNFSRLNIRILFPSLEGKVSKSNMTKTKIVTIKFLPILQIYRQLPCLTLKGSFGIKNTTLLKNFSFNNSFYYFTSFTEYKNVTSFLLNNFIEINNLSFKISNTYYSRYKTNMFYYTGLYFYTDFFKFLRIYGYEMGGEREKLPFIYWYKLFFTYRHILFNKRYIFIDLTPYIYYSKEYNFNPKLFFTASLNVKF